MELPIPQDWDGESWRCIQVSFPDSQGYTGLLLGLLTMLMRGRLYDARTGNIKTAQAIGRQIFARNYPFRACFTLSDCPECGGSSDASGCGGGIILEDDMTGSIVTDVDLVGGKIRVYFGPCCYKDLDMATLISDAGGELPDEPLLPSNGTPLAYSACGKALALVDVIYRIVEGTYNALDEPPWNYISSIESYVGYDLHNNYLGTLIADWIALFAGSGTSYGDLYDAVEKQEITCEIAAMLADDANGLTEAQYEQIHGIFWSAMMPNFVKWGLWETALRALGWKDASSVVKLGAVKTDGICDCPDEVGGLLPNFGAGEDWVHVFDFRAGLNGFVLEGTGPHQSSGIGLWGDVSGTNDATHFGAVLAFTNLNLGGMVHRVAMVVTTLGDDDHEDSSVPLLIGNQTAISHADAIALLGENPATLGTWTIEKAVNLELTSANGGNCHPYLHWYHPPDTNPPSIPENSNHLIAIGIAGSGADPLA